MAAACDRYVATAPGARELRALLVRCCAAHPAAPSAGCCARCPVPDCVTAAQPLGSPPIRAAEKRDWTWVDAPTLVAAVESGQCWVPPTSSCSTR